eukprot:PhF_6_TR4347/c0_g2_i1/m.5860
MSYRHNVYEPLELRDSNDQPNDEHQPVSEPPNPRDETVPSPTSDALRTAVDPTTMGEQPSPPVPSHRRNPKKERSTTLDMDLFFREFPKVSKMVDHGACSVNVQLKPENEWFVGQLPHYMTCDLLVYLVKTFAKIDGDVQAIMRDNNCAHLRVANDEDSEKVQRLLNNQVAFDDDFAYFAETIDQMRIMTDYFYSERENRFGSSQLPKKPMTVKSSKFSKSSTS